MSKEPDKGDVERKLDTKMPYQTTWKVGGSLQTTQLATSERNHLSPQDEVKILKNWRYLKTNVVIANIVDLLIEKGIYTPDQWMALKHNDIPEGEKVEEILYHLLKCKPNTYTIFMDALRSGGYGHVVNQLEGLKNHDSSPSVSVSSSGKKLF